MKIAVIGPGRVGRTLGEAWSRLGHEVVYGSRQSSGDSTSTSEAGASVTTPAAAAAWGDVVLLAVPWLGLRETVAGLGDLNGKVVIDATNPVALGTGSFETPRDLGFGSAGEAVAAWAPGARVVKAFNTTGSANLGNPSIRSGVNAPIFLCGDDGAKVVARELAEASGFDVYDLGGLEKSRITEAAAELWITLAYERGLGPDFALAVVRRPA